MHQRKLYLLDTCIYGVLVDKKHRDYETVQKIPDYAKKHTEQFVTTFIVYRELSNMKMEHKKMVLPKYYQTISKTTSPLEVILSDCYASAEKLSWRYIQKLSIKSAEDVLPDAENYALSSYAGIDVFVTINRKDLPAKEFQSSIKRINEEIKVKYVKIETPNEFLDSVAPLI